MVKPEYKQTEVGVIPEDWNQKSIREISTLKTGPFGTTLKASEYSPIDGVPLISVGEIREGYLLITDETPRISENVTRRLPEYILKEGDIVFGRKGSVERSALIRRHQDGWFLGSDGIRIRPKKDYFGEYVALQLQTARVKGWLLQNSTGTTMPSLNQEVLKRVVIPFPPTLSEQCVIVAALSDVDALLASLDALIAKKRLIQQGAMQELLTGKRRLPGFSRDWEKLFFSQDTSLKARIGWQGLTTAEYLPSGDYALITGTDFFDGMINWNNCSYVEKSRYDQDRNIQLRVGDVLLTKDGTIGKAAYIDHLPNPATLNSGVFVLRPKNKGYDPLFMYYILRSRIFEDFLSQLQAGSTINHLYQKDFVKFNFLAPSLEEQRAIADILQDMENDIRIHEQQRDKTRLLKSGMMQELLTGRTRLI